MDKNFNIIASDLFEKLRSQFPNLKLGDENSKTTSDPAQARFFEFDFKNNGEVLGRITINLDAASDTDASDSDELVVIYSNTIVGSSSEYVKRRFYNLLRGLRKFAKQNELSFDTRDITKKHLEKRDYTFLSKNFGDTNMSESKLFGTSKTSYQSLGDAKIIVKHSSPVNIENPAGRTQRIESIYIENIEGERFKYPLKHLNGARALAQHVAHGGTPYDNIGQHMIGLSEELSKLRMFKQYVGRNPVVSEAMGSIQTKVSERMGAIKKEIHSLQSPAKYASFVESFVEPQSKDIPEEILNDWIDRLTVRSFNEELKNVFPYIFKLVDESDIPVKELDVEDLVTESDEDDDSDDLHKDLQLPEIAQYENQLSTIVEGDINLFSEQNEEIVQQLNHLIADPIQVGVDGTNAIETLSDLINDPELDRVFKDLADISPDIDVRGILKDYVQIKDEEHGTDVLSKLTFPEEGEESELETPPEIPEPTPAEAPAPAPAPAAPAPAPAAPASTPVMASIEHKGTRFAEVIQRAVRAGMQLEDTFDVAGKQFTLKDAIARAGMQVEDFFGDKNGEIVEFVQSMYNREEGSFPKGETGVMIACKKKFGEGCLPIVKRTISELHTISEMNRIKSLAGLPPKQF